MPSPTKGLGFLWGDAKNVNFFHFFRWYLKKKLYICDINKNNNNIKNFYIMKTTSKRTNFPYFIEYVRNESTGTSYPQLVRTKDEVTLCTGTYFNDICAYCFLHGITLEQVIVL